MKITKIEQQKKNAMRYSIYIDGEFSFGLYEDVVVKNSLKSGIEITQDDITKMRDEDEYHIAWQKALRSITRSRKTEKELRQKLSDFSDATIEKIIIKAIDYGLIHDEEFARAYMRDGVAIHRRSVRMIEQKLIQKGVSKDVVKAVIAEADNELIESNIIELINKKYSQGKTQEQVMRFLAGRGYSWSVISSALEKRKNI